MRLYKAYNLFASTFETYSLLIKLAIEWIGIFVRYVVSSSFRTRFCVWFSRIHRDQCIYRGYNLVCKPDYGRIIDNPLCCWYPARNLATFHKLVTRAGQIFQIMEGLLVGMSIFVGNVQCCDLLLVCIRRFKVFGSLRCEVSPKRQVKTQINTRKTISFCTIIKFFTIQGKHLKLEITRFINDIPFSNKTETKV